MRLYRWTDLLTPAGVKATASIDGYDGEKLPSTHTYDWKKSHDVVADPSSHRKPLDITIYKDRQNDNGYNINRNFSPLLNPIRYNYLSRKYSPVTSSPYLKRNGAIDNFNRKSGFDHYDKKPGAWKSYVQRYNIPNGRLLLDALPEFKKRWIRANSSCEGSGYEANDLWVTEWLQKYCERNSHLANEGPKAAWMENEHDLDDIRIRVPRSRLARSRSPSPIACDRDHIGSHAYRPTHEYCTEYNDDGSRKPFVVRRVDKRLIHRVPGEIAPEPFPTSVNVEYRPRSRSQSRRPRSISLGRSSSAKLRSRSMSPARTKLTRGLYGVYESGRRESPAVEVIREPVHRPAYLDKTDDYSNGVDDAILAGSRYRYRPRSPSPTLSRYSRLREKLEEESLSRRIEDRVREALIRNRSYYVPYDDFYSRLYDVPSRYRYPYTSDSLDRLADDLERARIRRYYP